VVELGCGPAQADPAAGPAPKPLWSALIELEVEWNSRLSWQQQDGRTTVRLFSYGLLPVPNVESAILAGPDPKAKLKADPNLRRRIRAGVGLSFDGGVAPLQLGVIEAERRQ